MILMLMGMGGVQAQSYQMKLDALLNRIYSKYTFPQSFGQVQFEQDLKTTINTHSRGQPDQLPESAIKWFCTKYRAKPTSTW